MKLLVLLAVVVLVLWLARGGRRRVAGKEAPPPPLPPQEDVVACSQCGLHVPRSDALPGRGGQFCSEAHRAAFERKQE
jgi:uncharacterized protein